MSSATAAILADLEQLAHRDPAAIAALAQLGAQVDPYLLGLHDAQLSGWYNHETNELMTGFPVGPSDIVIDVGCGDGGALNFCAEKGAYVILADLDTERVTKAASWIADKAPGRVEKHITDANPLPLPDASVTRVICMEMLEHVDDPVVVMAELVRIGRPGARYLITVPDTVQEKLQQHLAPASYFEKPNHVRIFERAAFDALVLEAGLRIERRSYYGFYWAMWWLLFWECKIDFTSMPRHPVLDNWTRTWAAVLATEDGMKVKQLFDRFMPKNQVIVAVKPI
jgi:ubiquinone/menaquinone biosynthesis C-methylase UbiE